MRYGWFVDYYSIEIMGTEYKNKGNVQIITIDAFFFLENLHQMRVQRILKQRNLLR